MRRDRLNGKADSAKSVASSPRIAIISHSHPCLTKGGAETAAYALFRGLRNIGADAIFISACNVENRHRISFVDEHEFAVHYQSDRYVHFYQLAPIPVEQQLLGLLRQERVGLAHFHHFLNFGINSLRAARRIAGIRCFFTFHEFLAICHNHGQMITRPAEILCMKASPEACTACFPGNQRAEFSMRTDRMLEVLQSFDGYIAPSHFVADRLVEWGLPSQKMSMMENGLLEIPQAVARTAGKTTWTFGFFGQINPFKGVDVILDAVDIMASDKDLSKGLRIRIHGNFIGQSQTFIERFEASVREHSFLTYAGPYNSTSVHKLMSDCDYIIVPSKWWENSPVVIQEAYSVGTPVLCSGIGGMAEKVRDGVSGLHFRRGDAQDLARVIKMAANDKRAETLRAGIPRVISAEEMARQHVASIYGLDKSAAKELGHVEV